MASTVAEIVVASLRASGVRRVYGIPGDSLNGFTDALRRDRQHRDPAPVGVIQAVDQVQVARPAAACAHRQLAGQRGLRAGRERGGLLVAHVLPGDAAIAAHRIGEPIQGVTGNPVDPAHPRAFQQRHHRVSHAGSHGLLLSRLRHGLTPAR